MPDELSKKILTELSVIRKTISSHTNRFDKLEKRITAVYDTLDKKIARVERELKEQIKHLPTLNHFNNRMDEMITVFTKDTQNHTFMAYQLDDHEQRMAKLETN